ncbi:MAG TPA: chloride channel protein [Acidimicrobiales bacterium]|nr:chloride channel protein [Acidimicrobiales bacterium]
MAQLTTSARMLGRSHWVSVAAVLTGGLTGLGVAGFERAVNAGVFERGVLTAPLALQVAAPACGLVLAALALRWLAAGASPSTADEYIKNVHQPQPLPTRPVMGRLVASACTLGAGCALGFEGPSIYLGAAVGSTLQARLRRWFSASDGKVLLVCGAAAGVAAIFKAPATGAIFALEVPYQDDLARRMLLPALLSAASGYVTFAAINGTAPLFPVAGTPAIDLRDIGGAAVLGIACGLAARAFAWALRRAKTLRTRWNPAVRIAFAGSTIAAAVLICRAATGQLLALGPGYNTISWALQPGHSIALVSTVFVARAVATTAAVGGGGAGGLFIPLVVQGTLLGRALSPLFGIADHTIAPVLGAAAFLGAGYRVPLAAVTFVAETTGKAGFVVPGLIAAVVAQLVVGRSSVTGYQQPSHPRP